MKAHALSAAILLFYWAFSISGTDGKYRGRPKLEGGGWTQQYGDQYSSSYADYTDNNQFSPGWSYTTQEFVSQTSPSVDHCGILYYPLRTYVVAIAPNGTTIWKTGVSPNGNSYLTNTLYSKSHDFVVVGSTWVEGETYFQFVAVNATSGRVIWTKMLNELYHPTSISLSSKVDAVYVGGYDKSSFAAVRLLDGSVLWEKRHIYQVGVFMQTKVGEVLRNVKWDQNGKAKNYKQEMSEVVLLPTDPWDGMSGRGRLFAYNTGIEGS